MDRERKLLYAAVILAGTQQIMNFADHLYHATPPTNAALEQEVKTCQIQLERTYKVCLPNHHVPGKGI
ncbi:MAG TPA: hypothetical protein VFA65_02190 [Bryobacteraceae bacterium]|nr:hypothetical protein [Bryobacteraceae bacterium]